MDHSARDISTIPNLIKSHERSKSTGRTSCNDPSFPFHRPASTVSLYAEKSQPPAIPPRSKRLHVPSTSSTTSRPTTPTLLRPPILRPISPIPSQPSTSDKSDLNSSRKTNDPDPSSPLRPHRFINVSVGYPQLCMFCEDFVVTPRCTAQQCSFCKSLFHAICAKLSNQSNLNRCAGMTESTTTESTRITSISTSEQPVVNWNFTQVAFWLAVVGLGRFITMFYKGELDGRFLSQIGPKSVHLQRVVDPFVRHALRRAVLVLTGVQPSPGEVLNVFEIADIDSLGASITDGNYQRHALNLISFTREVACRVCKLPLLGCARQGYQCSKCGAIFHRLCKSIKHSSSICLGLSARPTESIDLEDSNEMETTEYEHLPTALFPYESQYFGIKLEDQPLDDNRVPIFLSTCTSQIERIASDSLTAAVDNPAVQPVNMVMVYQQSALANTLDELHKTFANNLPVPDSEQSSQEPLDVVRLAQLVKAFLRDLPEPVIPECSYKEFCSLASVGESFDPKRAVQNFLSSLPESNYHCLTHVINHLDFVWKHQRCLKTYLHSPTTDSSVSRSIENYQVSELKLLNRPISWLVVFRQILIRPPWNQITDLVTAADTHLRALEVLFFALASTPSNDDFDEMVDSKLSQKILSSKPEDIQGHGNQISISHDLPAPTVCTPPSPSSQLANKLDLEKQDWYWGDITQAEVRDIMAGLPDGYFLVRDASERSAGAFTLAVRARGENKLNRIYHRGDYFGVTDPPSPVFRLVSELIDFYRTHPPKINEYNGLRLIQPISRRYYRYSDRSLFDRDSSTTSPAQLAVTTTATTTASNTTNITAASERLNRGLERSSISEGVLACFLSKSQLVEKLNQTLLEINRCELLIADLTEQSNKAAKIKEEAAKLTKGYQKLREWLKVQLERLNDYSDPKERPQLANQIELLKEKLREAESQIELNKNNSNAQSIQPQAILTTQLETMNQRRKLKRQAQEIRRALKDRGFMDKIPSIDSDDQTCTNPQISERISSKGFTVNSTTDDDYCLISQQPVSPSLMIQNRELWFMDNITRLQVEELLSKRPVGTFVIRPSAYDRKLALGVRLATSVQHCLIHQVDGKFGFVEKACTFDSLEELVTYYHTNSLSQHNPMLTTTLRYPLNGNLP